MQKRSLHQKKLLALQKEVAKEKPLFQLNRSTNTLRKKKRSHVCLEHFNEIIHVGEDFVEAEPRITIRTLVERLFPLIPPVVPEFSSITVGGAIMGGALESSSWKYGQFNDCCLEYELLLGNGEILKASAKQNTELFYGISGSYGTLAILTLVKIALITVKPSVHLTIKKANPLPIFQNPPACDFLDAIRFSKVENRTMIGTLTHAKATHKIRFYSPWFYQVAQKEEEIVMSTLDYLFRFDLGAFWMGRFLFSKKMLLHACLRKSPENVTAHIHTPPAFFWRLLFGWMSNSSFLYRLLLSIPKEMIQRSFFIHDFYTPIDQVENFLENNQIYPIWLCPIKNTTTPQFLAPHFNTKPLVNVGLYGAFQRSLDLDILQAGGRKMLYSFSSYDFALFSKIYFNESYETLRKKFYAEKIFPHLYDKIICNRKSIHQKSTTSATT